MKKLLFAAVVGSSLMITNSALAIIIDHFEAGDHVTQVTSPPFGTLTDSDLVTGADAIGGTRAVLVTRLGGIGSVDGQSHYAQSIFSFSTEALTYGRFQLQYYGSGAGFAPTDLTVNGGDGVVMGLILAEYFTDVTMGVMDADYNFGYLTVTGDPGTPLDTIFWPFAGYTGIDFTRIIAVDFTINADIQADFSLDLIGTRERNVPDAAGTMTLLSLALGLLGVARWKLNA